MITQLIYMSEPFGYDGSILSAILAIARRNNARTGITGALICRHDIYLQLIEGDADAIDPLFDRIARDDRHLEVTLLSRTEVSDRMFPGWAMMHDPAQSWLWEPEEVGTGAVRDATPAALRRVFERAASSVAYDAPSRCPAGNGPRTASLN